MMTLKPGRWLILLAVAMVAAACSTPTSPSGRPSGSGEQPSAPAARQTPKQLTIGILNEPPSWAPWQALTTAGGSIDIPYLVTRTLSGIDGDGLIQPELAVSVPSLEKGDWRLNADGTMEQTWTLKPNLKWHDGSPLTADDFVFGYEIVTNPALPRSVSTSRSLITEVSAPDPQTVLFRFKSASPLVGQALFDPMPRHILGDLMASGDFDRAANNEYWTTAYIGAGPYRLTNWEPGAFQEFKAFEDFYSGKPNIDTVIVRFLSDANTLFANILSNSVDVALPDGISIDNAAELRGTWAAPGTGNTVLTYPDGRHFFMEFQHRADYAKPAAARDPRVRYAFYYSVDKEGVNQVENAGLGFLADSWVLPDDPRRPQFKDVIPEWRYDINQATRFMQDAGWVRGGDGILVNSSSGERLETEIRVTGTQGHARAMAIMASGFRQVGAVVNETQIPNTLLTNNEYRNTFPFASLSGYPLRVLDWEGYRYSCATAGNPATRWSGHRDGYCNPAAETLIEKIQVTIPEAERTALQVQAMGIILKDDMAGPPLYWQVSPLVFAKGVTGIKEVKLGQFGATYAPWNIEKWDKN
jgi:peptide/nickel transport system substrate-binding protein